MSKNTLIIAFIVLVLIMLADVIFTFPNVVKIIFYGLSFLIGGYFYISSGSMNKYFEKKKTDEIE